ncbi:MAG: phosphoribosylglycinamide formyltransferase [Thermomicrobiales bacterium]|nr:phosphoribosylglycinamide formyltransferase [Thermomicrobiales bacterium]
MQVDRSSWRLAVLVSGSGRSLENLLQIIARGDISAEIAVVVSSVAHVRALQIAAEAGIPTHVLTHKDARGVDAYSAAMYELLAPYQVDLVIMAGFLRRLLIFPGWENRILNIHPALLPQAQTYAAGRGFYGDHVHAAVLAHGDTESGATVHVVTDEYDDGPPLAQAVVPVLPDDGVHDLADRVFAAERELYPHVIAEYMAAHPELKL